MNRSNFSLILLWVIVGSTLLTSCNKDDSLDKTSVNEWIYNVMLDNYLWVEDLPSTNKVNFDAKPEHFFKSLLSKKDGKHINDKDYYYSYIEEDLSTKSGKTNLTYGYSLAFRYLSENSPEVYAAIKYVIPGSPAERAGLKRGDWIAQYNNNRLTKTNYLQFNAYTDKVTLTVVELSSNRFVNPRTIEMEAAVNMPENPILKDTTLLVNNKKIGYLMYNSFTSGPEDKEDKTYDNQLRTVFSNFSKENLDAFILDLRNNRGGLISTAQLLATMLAPKSSLGKEFCSLKYNEKLHHTSSVYKLDVNNINNGGANLDLKTLYVITSSETASASELIINGLKPYMKVILLGETTEGKNVGSNEFSGKSHNHPWILHPIMCYVKNSEGFYEYGNGFIPDFNKLTDKFDYAIGDPREYLLRQTLSVIETGNINNTLRSSEISLYNLPVPQTGPQAIIID